MVNETVLLGFLYEALRSDFGVEIATPEPERLRQKLYPLRNSDPAFAPLSFVLSPLSRNSLWIIRKPDAEES